jgi:uncharacterized membrane protein YcaP (DUF421 family)
VVQSVNEYFQVDWQSLFVPTGSILEIFIRGTVMFLAMVALLRVFRRQAGSVGIADLLVVVVIADAAQHGMAGDAKTITDSILLILTIVLWDYFLDFLGSKSKFVARILEPRELLLVVDGKLLRRNMQKEMITYEELMSRLRQQGIENVSEVKKCYLEGDGQFSVITKEGNSDQQKGNAGGKTPVN